MNETKEKSATLLLRIGLGFVFLYAAIAALIDPLSWIGFFPQWVRGVSPDNILITGYSLAEIALALWLLSGAKTFYASMFSAAALLGVVIFNFGALDIVFRDVGLFFAALSLIVLTKKGR